jgi:D-alanyl-D-alanine carboxypeptidase (penicillin-binding protein 5/6)
MSANTQRSPVSLALVAGAVAVAMLIGAQAFGRDGIAPPPVTASSVFAVNADTGQTLYSKNDSTPIRLHSITKLITAYVLVQLLGDRLSEPVTITQAHLTSGSSAGLRAGDVWTLQDLLYGMLLVSGNDAALAIADHAGRTLLAEENKRGNSSKRFVQDMTPTAAALGAKQARFVDPHGLSPLNVGTARDVGLIGRTVFRDPSLQPIWRCPEQTLGIGGPNARKIMLKSTIEMLGEDGIIGAKTGSHIGKNIYNLVVAWRAPNGQTIVAAVLGSKDHPARYNDMRAILTQLPRDFPELAGPARSQKSRC